MLNFGNKEFRNLEEQVRKNQLDISLLKNNFDIEREIPLSDLAQYTTVENLGKYYLINDNQHLYVITRYLTFDTVTAYDLGVFPAVGPQGRDGQKGEKGDKGDSIIGPRGYQGIQGAPGRGVDSLSGIDTTSYEASYYEDENGVVTLDTSADVDFGGETPREIDFKIKYKVPTDFYSKDDVDDKDADVLSDAKDYVDDKIAEIPSGPQGEPGVGISSIAKTSTAGLVDTYTVTYTDGDTDTFTVTNGQNGTNGTDGTDGVGIASIAKTGTVGLVDYYTITYTDGDTQDFTITNGANGINGTDGTDGQRGSKWFYGSGAPSGSTGILEGDMYLDTSADNVYSFESNDWTLITNIKGSTGSTGAPGADGVTPHIGSNNDWYIGNTDTGVSALGAGSNPNILINPDFKINQRGSITGYGAETSKIIYGVDRWFIYRKEINSQIITIRPVGYSSRDYLLIQTADATGNVACLSQTVEKYKQYKGKQVTFSVKLTKDLGLPSNATWQLRINDGSGNTTTQILDTQLPGVFSVTRTIAADADQLIVSIEQYAYTGSNPGSASTAVGVEWAKLELGGVATPFTEPDEGDEFVKCCRYFYAKNNTTTTGTVLIGNSPSASKFLVPLWLPTKMRIDPTITASGGGASNVKVWQRKPDGTDSQGIQVTGITLSNRGFANQVVLDCAGTGFVEDACGTLQLVQRVLQLDAEIYPS